MLKRLFQRSRGSGAGAPTVGGHPPGLPSGVRLYAIGDIHGRLDLLTGLEQQIQDDAEATAAHLDRYVVYLGDYVDRGFDSRRVLDHLIEQPMPGFCSIYLLGNHDVWLREFAHSPECGPSWVRFGGDATLVSYGVKLDPHVPEADRFGEAQTRLRERIPPAHLDFLHRLELGFGFGDYFFCHAGIRPDVPLERQAEIDLIMIREPFLSWSGEIGKIVVHGHTVEELPVVRTNRIGVDTGACWTNCLTSLVLEDTAIRFLSTGPSRSG